MQSSSQGRYQGYQGYQGYPYVSPIVTDVPTIDAQTAARWANLPRRPIHPGSSKGQAGSSGAAGSSQATQRTPVPPKRDIDANPVVYIDIPEAGSEVSRSIETPGSDQPEFVQDTIMYDPFENRRIDISKDDEGSVESSASGSTYSGYTPSSNTRPGPIRPGTLNLSSPVGSGQPSGSSSRPTPSLPGFMSKESQLYGGDGSDGFPISPIPISEFPEPPPAYTEHPTTPTPAEPRQEPAPPRTQVIVPDPVSPVAPMGVQYIDRKNLICHHCGMRVHTLVHREVGCLTHVIAFFVFFICLPFLIVVYMADYFKYKNHYCPNCKQLIGYETPIVGQKVNYVT